MKRKTIICTALAMVLALGLLSGCSGSAAEKEFSKAGVTITLTDRFVEEDDGRRGDDVVASYYSDKDGVIVMAETFNRLDDMTLMGFAEHWASIFSADISEDDGLIYFTYTRNSLDNFNVVYESSDARWVVQFSVYNGELDKNIDQFKIWAKTVKV